VSEMRVVGVRVELPANQPILLLRETHGDLVTQTVIPVDTQIREASANGVPLAFWPAARRGGEAYRKLLQELLVLQAAHEASGDARAEDAA